MTMCLSACQSVSRVAVLTLVACMSIRKERLAQKHGVFVPTPSDGYACPSLDGALSNCRFPSHVRQGMGCRSGQGLLCCALSRHVSDV